MIAETGLFIVFEGGDGVGKSTQVGMLCAHLDAQPDAHGDGGLDSGVAEVLRTFEPGDTFPGAAIRSLVLDPATGDLAPRAEALLYAADKAHHLYETVLPALDRGAVVVCDRYVDSMIAYQGAGRVLDVAEVEQVARWATADLRPHLTVLLDLDPTEAVGKLATRDRLEDAGDDFHVRARAFFLELAARDPERYLVLAARQPREAIAAQVAARVDALVSERSGTLSA